MKKYFTLYIALFSIISLKAQQIKGLIQANEKPVPFASIAIQELNKGTLANENGQFIIDITKKGTYTIVISNVGYQSITKEVTVDTDNVDLGIISLNEDVFGLEEVVVSGTLKETYIKNSPVKVDVITSAFLEKTTSPTNLVEAVQMVNGVSEVVACGVCFTNSISINGLPGPYTAVLIDGSPMYGNLASVYGLNGIPRTIIDRFEVIKGPSSTLYGSEAVAGVINVITKNPDHQPLLALDIMGTSYLESFGDISYAPKIGDFNGLIGINYAYINNFDDDNNDGFSDVINLDRVSLFTKWSQERDNYKKFTITGKYYYEDRRNGLEEYLKNRAYRDLRGNDQIYGESIYTKRFEVFGTYEFQTEDYLKLDYSFSDHDQDSYYGSDYYQAHQTIGFTNLVWNKVKNLHDVTVGATLRLQSYDDNTIATGDTINGTFVNEADNQFIPGVFVQDEWTVSDKLTLLTGARLDHYREHGLIFAPRFNVKYKPSTWTTLRGNFGTGFRIVNLFTEDHAFVTGNRTVEILEDLEPERSYNGTLNFNYIFSWGNSQGSFDIDAYYTYFTNAILPNYDDPTKIIYENSKGFAESKGIGINYTQSFESPLSYNIGFNLQRATQTEPNEQGINETSNIEFAAKWSGTSSINYNWKKVRLNFSYTLRLTGPMALPEVFDLDENGQPLGTSRPTVSTPFAFQNLQIIKSFKNSNFQVYAGIQNLMDSRQELSPLVGFNDPTTPVGFSPYFDTSYAFAPIQGREIYIGIKWNTGRRN